MKIAIITWFHYRNYGTALQVVALYKKLTALGNAVDVIQYYPRWRGKTLPDYSFERVTKSIINRLIPKKTPSANQAEYKYVEEPVRDKLFEQFLAESITLTKECKTLSDLEALNEQYDVFIAGSDQIWAPSIFDPHYFLDFVADPAKLIAYAPSIGLMTVKDRFVYQQMRDLIQRFQHLSVREQNGAEIIERMTGKKAKVVADPTLLLERSEWAIESKDGFADNSEPYLLAYFLGKEEEHIEEASRIAQAKGLRFRMIPHFEVDYSREGAFGRAVGPREFLSLFKNAAYVCTDSFHGLLFSMQFEKQFSAFERFNKADPLNQNSRIYNILKITGTEHRMIEYHGIYHEEKPVDYSVVNKAIQNLRQESLTYIADSLRLVENSEKKIIPNHVLADHSLCCGCGACANICPKSAIVVQRNSDGFYQACIDENLCIGCGRCRSVCQFETDVSGMQMCESKIYAYKDSDSQVLLNSSSGGFSYRLATELIKCGYSVLGCTFNTKEQGAKHILIDDIHDVTKMQGSKYMQNSFADAYKQVDQCDKPIAVFGTPCQIAAMKLYNEKRKDILYIDLICHGVPTYHLYKKYKDYICDKYGLDRERYFLSTRYKPKGWREIHIYTTDGEKSTCFSQHEDLYFQLFETTSCYCNSCYDCKWRDSSAADIRIGDFWGPRFENDKTGVNIVACMTSKGHEALDLLRTHKCGILDEYPIDDYMKYQQTYNEPRPLIHDELIACLADEKTSLPFIEEKYSMPFTRNRKQMNKPQRALRVLKLMIDRRKNK